MPAEVISILDAAGEPIGRAADALLAGKIVVLPTETRYGAAVSLRQASALARLRALREAGQPLTPHLSAPLEALDYIDRPAELPRQLMKKLWPGPVGLVFAVGPARRQAVAERLKIDPGELFAGDEITLRCPDEPTTRAIIAAAGGGVALTASGGGASAAELSPALLELADLVVDAGPTRFNKPSTLIKVFADRYEIVRAGVYDQRIIEKQLRTTILFVCSGNTCRSPMAEALARRILAQKLKVEEDKLADKGFTVMSAGAFAMPGGQATPQAVEAVQTLGGDLNRHRSRALTVDMINQADAIFTMGQRHSEAVVAMVPSARQKVQTLDPDGDIDDPIGSDVAVYLSLARELNTLLEQRLSSLL